MKTNDLLTPEGTKDYLFAECTLHRNTEKRIMETFHGMGYSELMTPGIEFYDVFNRTARYFPQESLYKLTDNKGRLLVLRPDSTMPIARVVATRLKDAPLPLRLCYNQKLYTNTPFLKGRSNEYTQLGMELIGSSSYLADMEILSAAVEILSESNTEQFSLEICDISYFKELMRLLPAQEEEKEEIRQLIKAKNYPALIEALKPYQDCPVYQILCQLPRLFGGEEVIDKAISLFRNPSTDAILQKLKTVLKEVSSLTKDGTITVDLGMVTRTDYYTGIIFKGYLSGYGEDVISGGRYDKLISEFGYNVPATGLAVNLEAFVKISEKQIKSEHMEIPDVLVCGTEENALAVVNTAKKLRLEGQIAEISLFENIEDSRNYAKEKGISKIIIVNGEEDTVL